MLAKEKKRLHQQGNPLLLERLTAGASIRQTSTIKQGSGTSVRARRVLKGALYFFLVFCSLLLVFVIFCGALN